MVIGAWMKNKARKRVMCSWMPRVETVNQVGRPHGRVISVRTCEMCKCEGKTILRKEKNQYKRVLVNSKNSEGANLLEHNSQGETGDRMARPDTVLPANEKTLACSLSEMGDHLTILLQAELCSPKIHILKPSLPMRLYLEIQSLKRKLKLNEVIRMESESILIGVLVRRRDQDT